MTAAPTNGALAQAAGSVHTYEISSELQKILAKHDKRDKSMEESGALKALLMGEKLLPHLTPEVMSTKGRIEQAILMAEGLAYLRQVLTESVVRSYFMPLQGNPRGFLTDRDKEKEDPGYHWTVVRECLIEAFTLGLCPVGNQFNIISQRMYVTRNGMTVLLERLPGLTDLRIDPGVPDVAKDNGSAVVEFRCSWLLHGKKDSMERCVPVRVNKGQGFDAMLGKADRKIKAAIYGRLTGTVFTEEGEVDADDGAEKKTACRVEAARAAIDAAKQQQNGEAEPSGNTAKPEPQTSAPASASAKHGDDTTPTRPGDSASPAAAAGNGQSQSVAKTETTTPKEVPFPAWAA